MAVQLAIRLVIVLHVVMATLCFLVEYVLALHQLDNAKKVVLLVSVIKMSAMLVIMDMNMMIRCPGVYTRSHLAHGIGTFFGKL